MRFASLLLQPREHRLDILPSRVHAPKEAEELGPAEAGTQRRGLQRNHPRGIVVRAGSTPIPLIESTTRGSASA